MQIRFCRGQKQPPEVFCKNDCSLKFLNFHWKTPVLDSLLNKVEGPQACNFTKKGDSNTGLFCCEKYEHFKNTYFEEHLQATASEKRVCNVRITKN